jgi:hypothetical protein
MSLTQLFRRFALIAGVAAVACYAQGDRGLLTGLVRDPSGAAIAGVAIRAVHLTTNVAASTETNAEGNYTLPYLLPGDYLVTANRSGFKQFERSGVRVAVNDRLTLNIQMELGAVSEKMVVAAEAPMLETTSSTMSTLIDNRRLTELPLIYGNPMLLQFLAPGTTWNAPIHYTAPWDSAASISSVNGGRTRGGIEFQLDGVADNNKSNDVAYTPSVEFVQEYKVETAAYDAAQGHASAWVNASLKSGTNDLHGSAYYYIQNPALNANSFFNNLAGQPKGDFEYRRWQTSAGGPLRRNKTFWFSGIERFRSGGASKRIFTMPTPAEKNGDFSALLALGSQYQIYDPWSTTNLNNGRYSRTPLAGNIVPQNRITDMAKKILSPLPNPNKAPSPTREGLNNFIYEDGSSINRYTNFSTRIDHNLSEKNRFFGRFSWSDRVLNGNGYDYCKGCSGGNSKGVAKVAGFDYTRVFDAQTVLDIRYGYTRSYFGIKSLTNGFDITTLGFPKALADQLTFLQYPQFAFGSNSYSTANVATAYMDFIGSHSLAGNVSRMQGRHLLRAGADFADTLITGYNHGGESGVYNFTGGYFNGPFDNSATPPAIASSLPGLLMGLPSSAYVNINASAAGVMHNVGLFFQDDWKISDRLTLNLGVRWELEGAPVERFDRTVRGFDDKAASPIEAAAAAAYARAPIAQLPVSQFQVKGGLMFAGVNGQPRGLYQAPKRNFMPRIGFAYALGRATVLRGGYGVFFDKIGLTSNVQGFNQTGFSQSTSMVSTLDNGVNFIATMANPFPGGLVAPAGSKDGVATFLGKDVSFNPTRPRTPYMQRWSFGVQRSLKGGFVADINYVGTRSTALMVSRALNYVPQQYLSTSPVRDQATIDALSRQVPNPFAGLLPGSTLNGANASVSRLLYRYGQFGSISTMTNEGYSWYHAAQTRLEKRFRSGYTIMGSWSWSKNMAATSFLNAGDARPERVISADDRTHRITLSGIYELPFGRGRKLLPSASGALGAIVNGWQVSGIYQFQTGEAFGLGDFIFYGDPTRIALSRGERDRFHWFNTAGFETNSSRQRASAIRYQSSRFGGLRAAPINLLDLSAMKKTKITERFSFELRAEAIDALNHAIFDVPNTSVTAGTFGTVTATKSASRKVQFALYLRF